MNSATMTISRLDIAKIKRGTITTDRQSLSYGTLFEQDVLQARSLLTERGWLFEELQVVDSKKEHRWA